METLASLRNRHNASISPKAFSHIKNVSTVVFVMLAFNRHKACLLELEDDVNDSPKPEFKLVIKGSLNRTCHEQLQQFVQLPGQLCPLVTAH
jgi:hypothetical protein